MDTFYKNTNTIYWKRAYFLHLKQNGLLQKFQIYHKKKQKKQAQQKQEQMGRIEGCLLN